MRDPGVGIVDHEHVARLERAAVLVQHVGHHLDEEGQLKRRGIALADEPTLAVTHRRGKVAGLDHRRAAGLPHGDRHFFGDGGEFVLNHLDQNGIKCAVHRSSNVGHD